MASIIKSVDNLVPGMIADRDVDTRGAVLLKAGTVISETHIRQMRKWNISSISISDQTIPSSDPASPAKEPQNDDWYLKERERIEALFSTAGDDKQMLFLKECILKHIRGH